MIVLYRSISPFVTADAGTQFLQQRLKSPRPRGRAVLMSRFNINRSRSKADRTSPGSGRGAGLGVVLLVLAVAHQIVDHRRIGQGRGVAEIAELVLRDLAQD